MTKAILIFFAVLGFFAVLFLFSTKLSVAGIETPEYTVELAEGNFEIRSYPDMVAAATPMENENSGFGKLFQFISGENEGGKKIAMTSPVLMPADGEGDAREMMFIVPKDVVTAGVPEPKAKAISIKSVRGGRFAVIRSSGRLNAALRMTLLKQLKEQVAARKLTTERNPIYAGYDPPWIPGPMRRNEVMLRLK